MPVSEPSSDDFAPLTTRERALVAGWEAEVERLRGWLANALDLLGYEEGEDGLVDEARIYLDAR